MMNIYNTHARTSIVAVTRLKIVYNLQYHGLQLQIGDEAVPQLFCFERADSLKFVKFWRLVDEGWILQSRRQNEIRQSADLRQQFDGWQTQPI